MHLKGSAYEPWHQYLLTHAIVRPGIDITGIRSKSGLIEAITAGADAPPAFDAQDVVD